RWGAESLEAREALREQDACVGRLIQKLNARVGEENYVVTITADHGMMPMPEVTGGHRLSLRTLLEMIDKKFGAKIALGGGFINLWFDQPKMKELGIEPGHRGVPPLVDGPRLLRFSREVADLPRLQTGRAAVLQCLHVRAGRGVRDGTSTPLDGQPIL